jgi:hypothetical protein
MIIHRGDAEALSKKNKIKNGERRGSRVNLRVPGLETSYNRGVRVEKVNSASSALSDFALLTQRLRGSAVNKKELICIH